MVAGGTAAHSDHARDIAHTLALADPNGNYKIRDEAKLITLAKEWDVETEGRDIYDVAHEVAEIALMEFGKPFGTLRFIKMHQNQDKNMERICYRTKSYR